MRTKEEQQIKQKVIEVFNLDNTEEINVDLEILIDRFIMGEIIITHNKSSVTFDNIFNNIAKLFDEITEVTLEDVGDFNIKHKELNALKDTTIISFNLLA